MQGRVYVLKPSGAESIHTFRRKPSAAEIEKLLGSPFDSYALSDKSNPNFLFFDPQGKEKHRRFNIYASVMSGADLRPYGTAALWVPGRAPRNEPPVREVVELLEILEPTVLRALKGQDFTNADWFGLLGALQHALRVLKAGYRRR